MSTTVKIIVSLLVLILVAFGTAFFTARYLVSNLDGSGTVTAPLLMRYSSEDGISFTYPDSYELASRRAGTGERYWDVLVFVPKGYAAPALGEGPPSISLSIFENIEKTPLETWVRGDARSNFKLATNDALASTTVAGNAALTYQHSGLYETDTVVVAHGGKIWLFEAGWLNEQDPIRTDFQNLIKSVQFTI